MLGAQFQCEECFDTHVIDRDGAEIPCPYCVITVKITGLGHGLGGDGRLYSTAVAYTSSTITFQGTREAILANVREVRKDAELRAHRSRIYGRTSISSGAKAIERHVRKAVS